jgi:hypothetical protein
MNDLGLLVAALAAERSRRSLHGALRTARGDDAPRPLRALERTRDRRDAGRRPHRLFAARRA